MRPLLLKMTAFGPFPDTEVIDFSALGMNPLFLINGPTGSGKTTILDAICFALYGKTTGDERDGAQMRCDLASAEKLCEVCFKFELSGQIFQIRRVPEQQRPKARGEGLTEQKPEAQLLELLVDGTEKLHVSSKVTDATHEIENLTGLSVDQFRQVMILPQGKFRQLLLAESAEREKIFSKLFQTRIYKQLENRLKEQAAEVRHERESLQQRQQGILETIEVAAAAELDVELEGLQPQVKVALTAKQKCEVRFVALSGQLQQGQMLQADFEQFDFVTGELQELELQQEQMNRDGSLLSHALDAERIRPVYVELQRCSTAIESTNKQRLKLQQQHEIAKNRCNDAEKQLQQSGMINQKQDQLKGELPKLAEQRQKLTRVEELRQQQGQLQQTVAAMTLSG
ncbi:MAG: SMC family ATPase, partial [Desulfuromusa sp.]|nr:SMC family ATPase [Desulfuromusa sp.]